MTFIHSPKLVLGHVAQYQTASSLLEAKLLTEEEEAEEEQIQLERSHSSARGQPAGNLGVQLVSLQARRLGSRCSASAAGPPGFAPTIYLSVGLSLLWSA